MTDIRLPDGSRLVLGFRKDPGARYWHAPDFDAVLRAFRGWSQDYFFMRNLQKTIDTPLGRPPDDEDLFRRVAHAVASGHLAWELPAPLVLTGGGGGPSTSSGGSSPPPSKTESKPPSKSAPPPSSPSAPPPKPTTPPPPKSAPPPSPKPVSGPKPPVPTVPSKPVPSVSVNVTAGVSIIHPEVPRPEKDTVTRRACAHDWVQITHPTIEQAAAESKEKAEKATIKGAMNSARGYLFEIEAVKLNEQKMKIKYAGVHFGCKKCGQIAEADILGEDRLGEVKSKDFLKMQKDLDEQAPRLLSIHRQLYPTSTLAPLVKLHENPSSSDAKAAWEQLGWATEVLP